MKKLIILLILVLAIPVVAQEPEAKTEWVIQDTHKLLLQSFHQRYQEDYIELIKAIKKDMVLIHKDMPAETLFNDQLQAFVIPKPKEVKNPEKKEK